jgi:septum formation protein
MKTVLSLASTSPRRRELLTWGGWMFHLLPVDIDESVLPDEDPLDYVMRMAVTKARTAARRLHPGGIAVAADTTVVDGSSILGKPANPRAAADMLWQLRGRTHLVHTAIAVIRDGDQEILTDMCTTAVPMRDYTDEEIFAYIASGDPFDKAGGYAIQHRGFNPVEGLSGCYANVVGLPMCHLVRLLRKFNIEPRSKVPENCRKALEYDCDIFDKVLAGEI